MGRLHVAAAAAAAWTWTSLALTLTLTLMLAATTTMTTTTHAANFPCASSSYSDASATPPDSPTRTTTLAPAASVFVPSADDPLTQNHWSEVVNLAAYRPALPALDTPQPTRTGCPHLTTPALKNWHDPATWGGSLPAAGTSFSLPANTNVLLSSCSVDPAVVYGNITIPTGSQLIFADADIAIRATGFIVRGALRAGSATCRLASKITITLHGSRAQFPVLPANEWIKGIFVTSGGTLDLHGVQYSPTWTRLARTASVGDSVIYIQDVPNWQPGQQILISTTELKDSRDFTRNEVRTISSVSKTTLGSSVAAVVLTTPLSFRHYGGREYQAEVALLSRNIVVQGDETNAEPVEPPNKVNCTSADGSLYPCNDNPRLLQGFGAHIMVTGSSSSGRFSGLQVFRGGQTNVLARYPIHFHMMGSVLPDQAFVRDCAVVRSFFRAIAVHGTHNLTVTENVAYDVVGHAYFLEDGVEEDNVFSFNFGAFVHWLGSAQDFSTSANMWGQTLPWYPNTPNMILPSDIAAGVFYLTNTRNDLVGNAASGGFTGFSFPSLATPVKLHYGVSSVIPRNRPQRSPYRGNTAHSTGFWWASAGAIYVGGELRQTSSDGSLTYTAGRSTSHDTCLDPTAVNCWDDADKAWLQFEDTKTFLTQRGLQNWGDRSFYIRTEMHDITSLSMNVFGEVGISQLLMQCRTGRNTPTWYNGNPNAGVRRPRQGWISKVGPRDYMWYAGGSGFQFYDVSQHHILSNCTFRNCQVFDECLDGVCGDVSAFVSLTHSDQFVPDAFMQATQGILLQNVTTVWRYSTDLTDPGGVTVSGRLQTWLDADGSVSGTGVPTILGSTRAGLWWKTNPKCVARGEKWVCPLAPGDSMATVYLEHNPALESQIGSTVCVNGNWDAQNVVPCPIVANVTHFGRRESSDALMVAVNALVTGPLIAQSGGWFVRFFQGTPRVLKIRNAAVMRRDVLLLAIPYPSSATFDVRLEGANWCDTRWNKCALGFRAVGSVDAVRSSFGDAYYFDGSLLWLRVVEQNTGAFPTSMTSFSSVPSDDYFTFANISLRQSAWGSLTSWDSRIVVNATCATDPCASRADVGVPPAFGVLPSSARVGRGGVVSRVVVAVFAFALFVVGWW